MPKHDAYRIVLITKVEYLSLDDIQNRNQVILRMPKQILTWAKLWV